MNRTTIKPYADEPYRIFFPVALLAGVLGVLLWPLFYAGGLSSFPDFLKLSFYPNFAHAHVMIQGFVGGFAIGFTGTALPKMVTAKTFHPWQLLTLLGLHISLCVFQLMGYTRVGDALFAAMMLILLACLGIRVTHGKSVPPPGMVLAGMGLISGTLGAAWMAIMGLNGDTVLYTFFQGLLYQAFILLPLLGIGGYIFPMILGTPNKHAPLGGPQITTAWKMKAAEGGVVGVLIIISYWVDAHSSSAGLAKPAQAMAWVRLLLCFVWITKESGWLMRNKTKGVMAFALRVGIFCLLGGMIAHALLQKNKVALDHSLYIGGFGLITMMVATRVLYGHSGQGQKFKLWTKPLTLTTGLVIFTMLTRVTADFLPRVIISHHVYAAILWVSVSIVWGIALLPSVRKQPAPSILPKKKKATSMMDMNFRK